MKDEEMAEEKLSEEEYKLSEEVIKPIYYKAMKNDYSFAKYGVECYLAGLKAGRPQWHDLRKDKNDLPKLDKTDMSDYVITDKGVAYYNGRVKSWYIQNEYILSDDVIAWCEIPTFDKE